MVMMIIRVIFWWYFFRPHNIQRPCLDFEKMQQVICLSLYTFIFVFCKTNRSRKAGILSVFVYIFLYFVKQIGHQKQVFCLALYHLYVYIPFFVLRQVDQQISLSRDCWFGLEVILNLLTFSRWKVSWFILVHFKQLLTFDIFRSKLVWSPLGGKAQSSPYSAGQYFHSIFTISKFVFPAVFNCVFLVGFPIVFDSVLFCISTAYFIVYFYLQFQLYLIAYFSQVKLGSDSSTHLKVFLQTHSGKLETATYLVRASLSNSKLELNSDLNLNLNLNSNFESGGPPSPSLIQPQDYKRGLLIIWKANKI